MQDIRTFQRFADQIKFGIYDTLCTFCHMPCETTCILTLILSPTKLSGVVFPALGEKAGSAPMFQIDFLLDAAFDVRR